MFDNQGRNIMTSYNITNNYYIIMSNVLQLSTTVGLVCNQWSYLHISRYKYQMYICIIIVEMALWLLCLNISLYSLCQ